MLVIQKPSTEITSSRPYNRRSTPRNFRCGSSLSDIPNDMDLCALPFFLEENHFDFKVENRIVDFARLVLTKRFEFNDVLHHRYLVQLLAL